MHLSVGGGPIYGAGDGVEMGTSRSLNELEFLRRVADAETPLD